jgi:hypothetical protein
LAVVTGIAPNELINAPDGMIDMMIDVLKQQAKERQKGA